MPLALIRRIVTCLLVATPAIVIRVTGFHLPPVANMLIFGAAIVGAAFLLAWAAEAAQKDISGALAIALLALIAVLPEYAVDLYYAFRSGSEPAYTHFAAANMTGSNRLLLGLGWPLVVLVALLVARAAAKRTQAPAMKALQLDSSNRLDIGFLLILAVMAFAIPLLGEIPLWFGVVLLVLFGFYLFQAGRVEDTGEEDFIGASAMIVELPVSARRATVIGLFIVSAAIILMSAEPFAEALVASGGALGIDSYFLVQWLAPLASEAPEFIIAVMFALRGKGAAAIGTLIAAKVNQWSLLVGSLPIAHYLGGGATALPLDGRQVEEFVLTATQTLMGVAIILTLRFHWGWATALLLIFATQFFVTSTEGRYWLSALQAAIAVVMFIVHWRQIPISLATPFVGVKTRGEKEPELSDVR